MGFERWHNMSMYPQAMHCVIYEPSHALYLCSVYYLLVCFGSSNGILQFIFSSQLQLYILVSKPRNNFNKTGLKFGNWWRKENKKYHKIDEEKPGAKFSRRFRLYSNAYNEWYSDNYLKRHDVSLRFHWKIDPHMYNAIGFIAKNRRNGFSLRFSKNFASLISIADGLISKEGIAHVFSLALKIKTQEIALFYAELISRKPKTIHCKWNGNSTKLCVHFKQKKHVRVNESVWWKLPLFRRLGLWIIGAQ